MCDFLREAGIEVRECRNEDKILKNQVKIALFFQDNMELRDFHVLREEKMTRKKHIWSGKMGFTRRVGKYNYLDYHMLGYNFHSIWLLTYPDKSVENDKNKKDKKNKKEEKIISK